MFIHGCFKGGAVHGFVEADAVVTDRIDSEFDLAVSLPNAFGFAFYAEDAE